MNIKKLIFSDKSDPEIQSTLRDGGIVVIRDFLADEDNFMIFDELKKNDLILACVGGAHRGIPQKPNHKRIAYVQSFDPVGHVFA